MSGIFITGTSSNVGKTIVTTCLTYAFQKQNINAIPYKPVQCGAVRKANKWLAPDVELYHNVYQPAEGEKLNSFLYQPRYSPHLAAKIAEQPIDPTVIKKDFQDLEEKSGLVLVEGAGGLAVPLIDEYYGTPELIKELNIPVVIVTHATVGTLNATTLTAHYAESKGLDVVGIIINGYPENPSEGIKDNPKMIEKITGKPIIGIVPEIDDVESQISNREILDRLIAGVDLKAIYDFKAR